MAAQLTIDELAARCAHYRDRTARLFELAGHWSSVADDVEVRLMAARLSTRWADHVAWWTERMPSIDLVPAWSADLDEAARRAAVALSTLADEGPTPRGLQGLLELVAGLEQELSQWAGEHDADVDAPTRRVLDLVVTDLRRDLDDLRHLTP